MILNVMGPRPFFMHLFYTGFKDIIDSMLSYKYFS